MGYSPTLPEDKHKRFHDRASAARYVSEIYNRHTTKRAIARWPIPGRILLGRFMMTEHDITPTSSSCSTTVQRQGDRRAKCSRVPARYGQPSAILSGPKYKPPRSGAGRRGGEGDVVLGLDYGKRTRSHRVFQVQYPAVSLEPQIAHALCRSSAPQSARDCSKRGFTRRPDAQWPPCRSSRGSRHQARRRRRPRPAPRLARVSDKAQCGATSARRNFPQH
jgi:hypothetical protein